MKQTHLFILVLFLLSLCSSSFAENSFKFQSELEFKHDSSILPGELENYSLYHNEDVKLLIGFFEKKTFLSEVKNLSNDSIRDQLFEKSSQLDVINNQKDRAVSNFKLTSNSDLVRIEIEYSFLKNNEKWTEVDVYVLSSKASSFAALQYPITLGSSEQKELKKGMQNFTLQDEKIVSNKSLFPGTTLSSLAALSARKFTKVLGNFLISESFAAAAEANNSCDTKKYIIRGEFTTKKGSALFNFQKLVNDLEDEASKSKPDEKQLSCLSDFYKKAKDNAASYWSQRGQKEGCIDKDGNILSKKAKTCSDSTYNEMTNSFAYLDKVDAGLNDFLSGKEVVRSTCAVEQPEVSAEIQAFSKLNASVQQTFCCSSGNGTQMDKGPLYSVLESENDNFKKMSPAAQAEMCLLKTKDENKKMLSADGLGDCLQNLAEGVGKILKDLVKTVSSLFDLETIKALGQFVANLPSSAGQVVKTIGEHIGAQLYSVTDCMSPYEAKQYMCKMVPSVAATLLGPGMIKSFAKALVDKVGKTAVAEMVLKAAQENKQFQKLKEIAGKTSTATKKVAGKVMDTKVLRPTAAVLAKVSKVLGKDVSTPIKDMVSRKAKAAGAAATAKAESLAKKVLKRETVVEEVADVKVPLKDLPKKDVTDMVQGADGVFREAEATTSTGTAVATRSESTAVAVVEPQPQALRLTSSSSSVSASSAKVDNLVQDMSEYRKAVEAGNTAEAQAIKSRMHQQSKLLSDEERVSVAKVINKDPLDPKAVIDAHNVGGPGRELGTYSKAELREKARIAEKGGIKKDARRELMEAGVLGGDSAAASEFVSLQSPTGRIPGRIVSTSENGAVIEYLNPASGQKFTREFTKEQLGKLDMKASEGAKKAFADVATPKPAIDPELNAAFDQIELEAKLRAEAAQAAKAVPATTTPAKAPEVHLSKAEAAPETAAVPPRNILEERVASAQTSGYVNEYGVAKADLQTGRVVKVKVNTMDGVKEVEGEIINGSHIDPVSGMPRVQVKYADGVITEKGNVLQGKPNYQIANADISTIEGIKPVEVRAVPQAEPVVKKPLDRTASKPGSDAVDPDSYSGKNFRQKADKDAVDILLKDHRVGERAHIDNLKKQVDEDTWFRRQATSNDRQTNVASQMGKFEDPKFDPKIYYATQAEEYNSAMISATKFSTNGTSREAAELSFKGRIDYDSAGNPIRKGSARDKALEAMKKRGASEEQIKEMGQWMNRYDETIPRKNNVDKAIEAQKNFEKLKPKLESALSGNASQPLGKATFEEMSQSLKDMMLTTEQREAAEVALRKIKCARPEWGIGDSFRGFSLKCD